MNRHIDEVEFTIFDTETTGLDPRSGDRIVEIAAVRFAGLRRLGVFHSMINPQRAISPGAFAVNKISAEMVASAPTMQEAAPAFMDFIKGSCLCSYNAGFDLEFLYHELGGQDSALSAYEEALRQAHTVDVLKMARRLMPGLSRYALWFVSEALGVRKAQEHRALSDVELTLEVFMRLKERYTAKGLTSFKHVVSLFGMNESFLADIAEQKVAQIQEALGLGAAVRIQYLSTTTAELTQRDVLPKEVKLERNHLYLVGRCRLRNEDRTFRLDNILHIEITDSAEAK